jgi:hypothetical protein
MAMFILKGILRAESQEKILIYLLVRESGYGKAIAEFYGLSQNAVQKQLARLEDDNVVVSQLVGRFFLYTFKGVIEVGFGRLPGYDHPATGNAPQSPAQSGKACGSGPLEISDA